MNRQSRLIKPLVTVFVGVSLCSSLFAKNEVEPGELVARGVPTYQTAQVSPMVWNVSPAIMNPVNTGQGATNADAEIISMLSHLVIKDNVVRTTMQNLEITFLPVRDEVLHEKRREAFLTTIRMGKIAVRDWLLQAARSQGIVNNEPEAIAFLEALELIETKSDSEIREIIKEKNLSSMANQSDFIDQSFSREVIRQKLKEKAAYVDEFDAITAEITESDNLILTLDLPFAEKKSFDLSEKLRSLKAPSARIVTFTYKPQEYKPGAVPSFFGPTAGGMAGNLLLRALQGVRMLMSNNSVSFNFMSRPWIQHVRNLDTNEVYMSTDDPDTWFWEKSFQVWVQLDNIFENAKKGKPAVAKPPIFMPPGPNAAGVNPVEKINRKARFRIGYGYLWGSDSMQTLSDINLAFVGGALDVTTPGQASKDTAIAANVKAGFIINYEAFKSGNYEAFNDYFYMTVSGQRGFKVNKQFKKFGLVGAVRPNVGAIMNYQELFNIPTMPVMPLPPIQPVQGQPGTIGNVGGGPITVFPSPGLNPVQPGQVPTQPEHGLLPITTNEANPTYKTQ